jgi:methionine aminopeptidase
VIELKTPTEIQRMHVAGRFVAEVLSEVGQLADAASTSWTWSTTCAA